MKIIAALAAKATGMFCLLLGVSYASIKFFGADPKILYLAPFGTLGYLGTSLILGTQKKRDDTKGRRRRS